MNCKIVATQETHLCKTPTKNNTPNLQISQIWCIFALKYYLYHEKSKTTNTF